MAVTHQKELFHRIMPELAPLFLAEWNEVSQGREKNQELDVDWDKYVAMELSGLLLTVTARVDGKLAGYALTVIHPHFHFKSTLYGFVDAFYVLPDCRDGEVDAGLLEENEIQLIEAGVKRINMAVNPSLWLYKLMKALQYKRTECILAKWL